ncbi:exported hypothetical protein [Cupriavidus taiwanensis]|nr:exported hypothetical protein [Cupriavidus taiwanensis]SOZ25798.1 exported hypothetical protein [Cupriavidus taiwanensis]SOZ45025.1 exported hypothetical protein [Cupriavidus taiwanensis]SPA12724.1 exported hypothetical protein [Cupriavidus taiwanensis]
MNLMWAASYVSCLAQLRFAVNLSPQLYGIAHRI